MTNEEFKLEFNTYFNNITSNQAPGVNDYEISQFLTLAEEQIVSELYESRYSGFEKTEELRKSLDALLQQYTIDVSESDIDETNIFETKAYKLNFYYEDVLYVVMEWAKIGIPETNEQQETTYSKERTVEVIPIKYDDFLRTYKNSFRGVSKKRVIRLDASDNRVILHSPKGWDLEEYNFQFIKKPKPIIIGNSDFTGLTINGYDAGEDVECELDSSIHRPILLRAVQLAKAAWQSK